MTDQKTTSRNADTVERMFEAILAGKSVAAQMIGVFTSRRSGETLRMPYVEVYGFEDGPIRTVDVYPQDAERAADFMAPDLS